MKYFDAFVVFIILSLSQQIACIYGRGEHEGTFEETEGVYENNTYCYGEIVCSSKSNK